MNKVLDERELCDLECLSNKAFAPLETYMSKANYESCLTSMRLANGSVWPIPIVCSMPQEIPLGTSLTLRNQTGVMMATLTVSECWKPDIEIECTHVFGCFDTNHPYIHYLVSKGDIWYVSGEIRFYSKEFHSNYQSYRISPEECKKQGPWVGFQTRNPLHRSHVELIKRSQPYGKILLHPVEGVTQECDIPFSIRIKCYEAILGEFKQVKLAILPLSMRMAGPREAVWHALIRKQYGCSHFIVGRDHAGPSYKKKDGTSFFDPLEAQRLAKSLESDLGIKILTYDEMVYSKTKQSYIPVSEATNHTIEQISGTEIRKRLHSGEPIPTWFSYPSVLEILKGYFQKRGLCVYFVGLSGSGKTTMAERLKGYLEETLPMRSVTLLDADIIRTHLSKGLGFSKEDRSQNVRRIGYVASEIVKHGGIVLVANIAPYEEDREWNRKLISEHGHYVQVFLDTPLEECERRDVKGLYQKARQGLVQNFTGISDPFEPPTTGLILKGQTIEQSLETVVNTLLPILRVKRALRFIHISKTGGSAVEFAGKKIGQLWGQFDKEYGLAHDIFPNKSTQYKYKYDWFTVVRNPYTRILSEYNFLMDYIIKSPKKADKQYFNEFIQQWMRNTRDGIQNDPQCGRVTGDHFTEQYKYIDPIVPIRILKFESLSNDFTELLQEYSLPNVQLDKVNVTKVKYMSAKDFSQESIDLIREVYRRDFELFGYSMELPT